MNKLIATNFHYTYEHDGRTFTNFGSYLGRKAATMRTIRRFLNGNFQRVGLAARLRGVSVLGSYVSPWIAKVLIVFLLSAGPVFADVPTSIFTAGAAADWASTYHLLKSPTVRRGDLEYFPKEQNPLIGWADTQPAAMIALGAGIDAAGVLGWNRLTKNHPKIRAAGLIVAGAGRFAIAYRNYRLAQRFRSGRMG